MFNLLYKTLKEAKRTFKKNPRANSKVDISKVNKNKYANFIKENIYFLLLSLWNEYFFCLNFPLCGSNICVNDMVNTLRAFTFIDYP